MVSETAYDVLDLICLKYYGKGEQFTEVVLKSNPGLSGIGPVLPSNLIIELPDLPNLETQTTGIRLWS